jgi:twitching motility protein PilT
MTGDQGAQELNKILEVAVKYKASDVHIKAGLLPVVRIHGELRPLKDFSRLTPDAVTQMAYGIMEKKRQQRFQEKSQIDLAYGVPGLGRFRVNVFQQRGTIGIVLRIIPFGIKKLKELKLPGVIGQIAKEKRGLILVTGTTGSGKTTTLASMIDQINEARSCHIVTIEDPIELLHRDKKSIINQREIGFDTDSFGEALHAALRQDPDVILVGEMRDLETMDIALKAADTGHLVLSTLHTIDATETITRIVTSFPEYQRQQIRLQLASIVKGIICQRLVPTADGKGRIPAVEILVSSSRVREYIEIPEQTKKLRDAIAEGAEHYGMQTFDQSLMVLFKNKLITFEVALDNCSNKDNFKLAVSGVSSTSDAKTWGDFNQGPEDDDDSGGGTPGDELEIERF